MTSVYSYLLTMIGVFFWIFRVIVAFTASIGIEFPFVPLNITTEIIVLFLSVPAFVFVLKRNIVGAAAYLAINFAPKVKYFLCSLLQLENSLYLLQPPLISCPAEVSEF